MKATLIIIAFFSNLAFAGKTERDLVNKTVAPKIAKAEAAYKTNCGCALKIELDPSLNASRDLLMNAGYFAGHVEEDSKKCCEDADGKKALCKMTTIKVIGGDKVDAKVAGSTGTATVTKQMSVTFESFCKLLDK